MSYRVGEKYLICQGHSRCWETSGLFRYYFPTRERKKQNQTNQTPENLKNPNHNLAASHTHQNHPASCWWSAVSFSKKFKLKVYENTYKNFHIPNINKKVAFSWLQTTTKMKFTPILLIHSNTWRHSLKEIKISFPRNWLLQKFYNSDSSADRLLGLATQAYLSFSIFLNILISMVQDSSSPVPLPSHCTCPNFNTLSKTQPSQNTDLDPASHLQHTLPHQCYLGPDVASCSRRQVLGFHRRHWLVQALVTICSIVSTWRYPNSYHLHAANQY